MAAAAYRKSATAAAKYSEIANPQNCTSNKTKLPHREERAGILSAIALKLKTFLWSLHTLGFRALRWSERATLCDIYDILKMKIHKFQMQHTRNERDKRECSEICNFSLCGGVS
jgi:hypothetical protein